MNKLISVFKSFQLDRVVIAFLAGVLLLVSTGCTSPEMQANARTGIQPNAQTKVPAPYSSGSAGTANDRVGQQTELYDTIQERKGGMNEYSDVEPQVDTKGVNAKATGLIRNAENNLRKVNTPKDLAEEVRGAAPIREGVRNTLNRATDAVQGAAEDVSRGARRGSENLKDNAQNAGRELSEGSRDAARKASDSARDQADRVVRGTQQRVEDAADALDRNRA